MNTDNTTQVSTTDSSENTDPKLPLLPLTALAVGSMIGSGIFGLPSQMAGVAAVGPLVIGWIITGIGMLALAFSFQSLARTRPDVTGGVYGYAREGLGSFAGFASAWSYWLSAWAGNLSYVVFLTTTVAVIVPAFKNDDNSLTPAGVAAALVFLWIIHFLILSGVRTAAFVNTIITVAKVIPLFLFVVIAIIGFKAGLFSADVWGEITKIGADSKELGSPLKQITSMMLLTVWVFIGIEGAAIYSTRAKSSKDVGKATVMGFLFVLGLLVLTNVLSYGVVAQAELAGFADPSMAGVMAAVVGPWGAAVIHIGIGVSVAGALLAWVMLASEILFVPAEHAGLPAVFGNTNKHGSPTTALWVTNGVSSIVFIILAVGFSSTYTDLILIASSLILPCYLVSAFFQLKQSLSVGADKNPKRTQDVIVGVVATVYTVWLVWAGGLPLILLNAACWLVGAPLYIWGRKQAKKEIFTKAEMIAVGIFAVFTVGIIYLLATHGMDILWWNGL
ncbi:MAG: basic amino acid/polyamine antiporter [Actinomycetaceae bacterium]|nr:basic amino acid/polyamine antiporter [Actinomycetaceae bacterium]